MMSKVVPLNFMCFLICLYRDCPPTREVLQRGGGMASICFTCTLACRQDAHFCLCRDRRISVTFDLHKYRAISQRLASSVGIRYTNKVFEQDSAKNYCLLVQHNPTCRVRVDPGNGGVGPVVWSALLMTGCCKIVTSVQS